MAHCAYAERLEWAVLVFVGFNVCVFVCAVDAEGARIFRGGVAGVAAAAVMIPHGLPRVYSQQVATEMRAIVRQSEIK